VLGHRGRPNAGSRSMTSALVLIVVGLAVAAVGGRVPPPDRRLVTFLKQRLGLGKDWPPTLRCCPSLVLHVDSTNTEAMVTPVSTRLHRVGT
jgi:hypothetical protein